MSLRMSLLSVLALVSTVLSAQECPLNAGNTAGFPTQSQAGGPVMFSSELNVNVDGAPNAYHRLLGAAIRDPGLLHICNGVTVLERKNGKMVNRYPQIGGSDRDASSKASKNCKADVYELQEQGFPACSSGSCLRIFGFAAEPRACGEDSSDMGCGVPVPAMTDGQPTGYWISTLSWFDRSKAADDPARYPDPRYIPLFVLPGGERGAFARAHNIRLGDIALVTWHGQAVFAAFADAGPRNKLGEASPALINRLRGMDDSETRMPYAIPATDRATTLLFPGTRELLGDGLPADAAALHRSGMQALNEVGGLAAFSRCSGLSDTLKIATQ